MKQHSFQILRQGIALEAGVSLAEGAVSVLVTGGTKGHIGSTVLAVPRPSLTGTGTSCTSSVLNLTGHKDEAFARPLAERICREMQLPAAVSVGVHMDNASADDLALLASMFEALCKEICAYLKTEVQ